MALLARFRQFDQVPKRVLIQAHAGQQQWRPPFRVAWWLLLLPVALLCWSVSQRHAAVRVGGYIVTLLAAVFWIAPVLATTAPSKPGRTAESAPTQPSQTHPSPSGTEPAIPATPAPLSTPSLATPELVATMAAPSTPAGSTPPPVPPPSPAMPGASTLSDSAQAAAAARIACTAWGNEVRPVVTESVNRNNLAIAIRLIHGFPDPFKDAGLQSVSVDAPWLRMSYAAGDASVFDPQKQPIHDAVNYLEDQIVHADPSSMLSGVAQGASRLSSVCASLS